MQVPMEKKKSHVVSARPGRGRREIEETGLERHREEGSGSRGWAHSKWEKLSMQRC